MLQYRYELRESIYEICASLHRNDTERMDIDGGKNTLVSGRTGTQLLQIL